MNCFVKFFCLFLFLAVLGVVTFVSSAMGIVFMLDAVIDIIGAFV